MKNKKIMFASLMLLAFATGAFRPFNQMTILSGSKQATQYQYVQDIETIVGPVLNFEVVNKKTTGDSYNFDQIADPKSPYKLAIMQADYLYYMQAQDMRNNTEKTKNLKVVLPLGNEQIQLVTKVSKGFKGLKDMEKKTVAIGSADQGTYRTAMLIRDRSQVNWTSRNTYFEDCLSELNHNNIDAFFIVSPAPIAKLDLDPQSMVDKLALVPLENFNDWAKYYRPDTIHKAIYKWLDHDIPTFSVPALLVVNESKLSDEERDYVLKLKSGIQSKYEQLKANGHPKWKQINLADWKESDWPYFK